MNCSVKISHAYISRYIFLGILTTNALFTKFIVLEFFFFTSTTITAYIYLYALHYFAYTKSSLFPYSGDETYISISVLESGSFLFCVLLFFLGHNMLVVVGSIQIYIPIILNCERFCVISSIQNKIMLFPYSIFSSIFTCGNEGVQSNG